MRWNLLGNLITVTIISFSLAACGGTALAPKSPDTGSLPQGEILPPLGATPRAGTIVDNDVAWGNTYYDSQNSVDTAPATVLESPGAGVANAAYALYQIVARVGDTPYMLTVNTLLYDSDPLISRPEEVFWIAYGDFTGGGPGYWHFTGPFTGQQNRITLPPAATVVNSAGLIYVAVLALDSNRVRIGSVQVGYDLGVGYEQYRLAQPKGSSAGHQPQIEIDSDGNPQIAYLQAPIGVQGGINYRLKVARQVGGSWESSFAAPYVVEDDYAFACGDGGRRAIVVREETTDDLHLLYDDGSGTFATDTVIYAGYNVGMNPDVVFINGADDPLGVRDTVLVVHGANFVWPNCEIHYYRADEVNPPATGNVVAGNVHQLAAMHLMVEGNQATLALPVTPVPPQIDCTFLQYAAVIDAWAPSPIPTAVDIDVENDDNYYFVQLEALGGGNYAIGYVAEDSSQMVFMQSDGLVWGNTPQDRISCNRPKPLIDFGVRSDGTLVSGTSFGSYFLGLYRGTLNSGTPYEFQAVNTTPYCVMDQSLVVVDNVTHLACTNIATATLDYYQIAEDGTVTSAPVDVGGDEFGLSFGSTPVVQVGDALHVFYYDAAHLKLVHAENHSGVWVSEAEPIPTPGVYPYFIMGAGYLENTSQLWVAFGDALEYGVYLVTGTPQPDGGWTWECSKFLNQAVELLTALDDDETNIGCVYATQSLMSQVAINFAFGPPGQLAAYTELIGNNIDVMDPRWILGYNPLSGAWDFMAEDDSERRCQLFHRDAPGVWFGPMTIAERLPVNDKLQPIDFTYDANTGWIHAVLAERDDATNERIISVINQTSDAFEFSAPVPMVAIDLALNDYADTFVAPDADGFPMVAVLFKALADPTYTAHFFAYDGIGVWLPFLNWASPIGSLFEYPNMDAMAVMPDDQPAIALVNSLSSASDFGMVYVYYPW